MYLFKVFRESVSDIRQHHHLASAIALRDTKAKYRGSLLGYFWAVFTPLGTALVMIAARGAGVFQFGETSIPYPVYIILGMSLWQLFTASITQPLAGLQAARSVLTKLDFPREVIVVSELQKLIIFAAVQAGLVIAVSIYFGSPVSPFAPLAIFPIAILVLLGLTVSMLLAPVALLYGDLNNAIPSLLMAVFVLTPVVYPAPTPGSLFATVVWMNPVTWLIDATRHLLYAPELPQLDGIVLIGILLLPLAIVSLVIFRISMPVVVERWSS